MIPTPRFRRRTACSGLALSLFLLLPGVAGAQTRPDDAAAAPVRRRPADPVPTTSEVTAAATTGDAPTLLSPFTVSAEADQGYRATSTLAGTRINTNLRDLGAAISVVTKKFLDDTSATNIEDLLVYTPNTEVGGLGGNFLGASGTPNAPAQGPGDLLRPNTNTRVRGLAAAAQTRDFFLTDIPWDSYITERVDLQRGPNSMLFGIGAPGGVVNTTLSSAQFKDSNKVELRFGSYGSERGVLDLNRVLLPNQLAVRVVGLRDNTYYEQDPAFADDRRTFAALRFDPQVLNGGSAHTTLRVNFEHGNITSDNPRTMPPNDDITPWFQTGTYTAGTKTYPALNKATYDPRYSFSYLASVPGSGPEAKNTPGFQPWVEDLYGGSQVIFPDPNANGNSNLYLPEPGWVELGHGLAPSGAVDGSILGLWQTNRGVVVADHAHFGLQAPGLQYGSAYKNTSLTDPSIFDFYHKLLDGPNRQELRSFEAVNAVLDQTFLHNRLGLQAAFDHQLYHDETYSPLSGGDAGITVDINTLLPDGTPNPNVGRPMVWSRSYYGGTGMQTERDSFRLTGFAELRASDFLHRSWLTKLLGSQTFTGLYGDERYDHNTQNWMTSGLGSGASALMLNSESMNPYRELMLTYYLGPDMRSLSSPAGLRLSNISANHILSASTIRTFDARWNKPTNPTAAGYVNPADPWVNTLTGANSTQSEYPANYVGWVDAPVTVLDAAKGDKALLTYAAQKDRDTDTSKTAVWQGRFWDGLFVGIFGLRQDTAKSYIVSAPITPAGYSDQSSPSYVLPGTPNGRVTGDTRSYSGVLHTPQFIRKWLPVGLNFDLFYNQSENFEPASGRFGVLGEPLPAPTGKTKDYGVTVAAFHDRLILKVTKYKTSAQNATFDFFREWYIGFVESRAWVRAKRLQAGLSGNPLYSSSAYNYGSIVNGVFVQSAQDRADQLRDVNYVLDHFDQRIIAPWGMSLTDTTWQNNLTEVTSQPGGHVAYGLSSTADTQSQGYEVELNFRPIDNWDIALNASKTQASRSNIGGDDMNSWLASRNAVWNGPGGLLRVSGTDPTNNFQKQWNNTFYTAYVLQRLLEGTSAPEIRPRRVNVWTDYRFATRRLKGVHVGGAYRWEDKIVLGYPSVVGTVNGVTAETFDVSHPFMGPVDTSTDLWVGYDRAVAHNRIKWRVQLNVRNAFGKNELVPYNVEPDGSPAAFRIKEGPTWYLTNRFEF